MFTESALPVLLWLLVIVFVPVTPDLIDLILPLNAIDAIVDDTINDCRKIRDDTLDAIAVLRAKCQADVLNEYVTVTASGDIAAANAKAMALTTSFSEQKLALVAKGIADIDKRVSKAFTDIDTITEKSVARIIVEHAETRIALIIQACEGRINKVTNDVIVTMKNIVQEAGNDALKLHTQAWVNVSEKDEMQRQLVARIKKSNADINQEFSVKDAGIVDDMENVFAEIREEVKPIVAAGHFLTDTLVEVVEKVVEVPVDLLTVLTQG